MTPRITQVEPRPGYKLHVVFEDGETRLFDLTPYLDKGVFRELRDESYFRRVRPIWGGVEWPNEQDLSADTLYCRGSREKLEAVLAKVPDVKPPDYDRLPEDGSRRRRP